MCEEARQSHGALQLSCERHQPHDLRARQAEARLSEMVVAGAAAAKINRPAGIVRFAPRRAPAEHLNGWAANIRRLLEVVERATQDIQKESMVHKVPIGVA